MPDERGLEVTRGTLRESSLKAPVRLTTEDRALALGTDEAGGFAVPKQLDGVRKPAPTGHWDDPKSDQAEYGFTGKPAGRT